MNKRKKTLNTVFAVIGAVGFTVCLVLFILFLADRADMPETYDRYPNGTDAPTATAEPAPVSENTATPEPTATPVPVDVPVDFAAWQETNPDVYAWISFPEAEIDYPVLQNPEEDSFYLYTDVYGEYSLAGSIYTQHSYNSADFNDPVTVIYGHNMSRNRMFGALLAYVSSVDFAEEQVFIHIYMPNRILTYRVIGGVTYGEDHILFYNDFDRQNEFDYFFDNLLDTRSFYNTLQSDLMPEFGDRVIILSTCMDGDRSKRYLTLGVLTEDIP